MAELTSQDFQKLLAEQARTNELLTQVNKDPSLPSSIKQNLGEILNASRLAGQSEKFQEQTGITKTDDEQRKTTQSILDTSQRNNKNLVDLIDSNMLGNMMIINELKKVKDNGQQVEDAIQQDLANQLTPSQLTEQGKDERSDRRKLEDTLKGVRDGFKDFVGNFKGILSRITPASGSMLSRLLKLGGLFLLFKFLMGPEGTKFAEQLDEFSKNFKGFGKKIGEFVGFVGKSINDLLADINNPDKTAGDVLKENGVFILGAIATLYSRSIIGFGTALLARAFTIKNIAGFSGFISGAASRVLYGKGGAAGFAKMSTLGKLARVSGVVGAVFAIVDGVSFALSEEGKEQAKNLKTGKAATFAGGAVGGLINSVNDLVAMIIGTVAPETAKNLRESQGDARQNMAEFFDVVFTPIMDFFTFLRKLVMGRTLDDLNKELFGKEESLLELNEELKGLDKGTKEFNQKRRQITLQQKDIEQMQKRIDNFDPKKEAGLRGIFFKQQDVEEKNLGGPLQKGSLALIGEGSGGRGGELVYTGEDAMVMNQSRTDQLLTAALEKGLSGGGEGGDVITQIDGRVNNSSSILSVNNNRVTNPNSTLNAIAMST